MKQVVRPHLRHAPRVALVLALVLAAALGLGRAAAAAPKAPVISIADIPLHGFALLDSTGDLVELTGMVHIVTQVVFSATSVTVTVSAALPPGAAAAQVPADPVRVLIATGAGQATVQGRAFPSDPVRLPGFFVIATPVDPVSPPDPILPQGFILELRLSFTAAGVLNPATSSAGVFTGDVGSP